MHVQVPWVGPGQRTTAGTAATPDDDHIDARAERLAAAFRDNRRTMYALARRICGEDQAADAVQDVFLRVWRDDAFDPTRSSIRAYLMMMTRSVAIDVVRRTVAQKTRDHRHAASDEPVTDDADLRLFREHTRARVDAALSLLSANERAAIHIAFFEQRTHREVAACLGIPEGTVKSRIRLAMIKLRHHLRDLAQDPTSLGGGLDAR